MTLLNGLLIIRGCFFVHISRNINRDIIFEEKNNQTSDWDIKKN
jgi:hypothetical protein